MLEHADGLIAAVGNLLDLVRPDGTVLVVVPDIRFLVDAQWMPRFDFAHHIRDTYDPNGWLGLFIDVQRFLSERFSIQETHRGMGR